MNETTNTKTILFFLFSREKRKNISSFVFKEEKKHIFHFRFHRFKEIGENIFFSLIFKGREFSLGNSNFFFLIVAVLGNLKLSKTVTFISPIYWVGSAASKPKSNRTYG